MKKGSADVVVIGGGVVGCAIARELALRGTDVTVVERDSPGRRATWAAAGMLSPLGEAAASMPFLELSDESLRRFGGFAYALREETSIDIEYRTAGKLHVSLGDHDTELRAVGTGPLADRFEVTVLDGAAARRAEPLLSEDVTLALQIGRDHRVNNRLLAQALLASATAAGATFRTASPVTSVNIKHGHVHGVKLSSGEQIETRRVVVAAGAWSGDIEGLRRVPVRPVKGQMFAVDARARSPERPNGAALERVIFSAGCYIIPRDDGRLLVGATMEEAGFMKGPTPRGIMSLMAAAARVLPITADLPLVETWAGFRPATPDGLPILGEDPDRRGVFYATGHFRNGILLSPVTAALMADLVGDGKPFMPLDAFRVERFG